MFGLEMYVAHRVLGVERCPGPALVVLLLDIFNLDNFLPHIHNSRTWRCTCHVVFVKMLHWEENNSVEGVLPVHSGPW